VRLPQPVPGLVVRYSFLWHREHEAGREEGSKDRPCAVILSKVTDEGDQRVYVLPITHSPPQEPDAAIEIPAGVKRHLGLDSDRSWIVLDEVNDFLWPGFDLRSVPGSDPARPDHGLLPPRFFARARDAFVALYRQRRVRVTPRS
jgi:PemK-like, MazF-like toxin of type II toxin-antitoxin system